MSAVADWLEVQCGILPGATHAAVLEIGAPGSTAAVQAQWPASDKALPDDLIIAAQAAARGAGVVRDLGQEPERPAAFIVACPLDQSDAAGARRVAAVQVQVQVHGTPSTQHRVILQILQWGARWLALIERERAAAQPGRLALLVDLLTGSLAHERFEHAAMALVTEIAGRLGCERVSLGLARRGRVGVEAVSHSAQLDQRSTLLRQIATAMEEAIDQDATVVYPPIRNSPPLISFAQEVLASTTRNVCTTPLLAGGEAVGALTLERGAGGTFDSATVELCESLGALLGPVLALKREHDRSLPRVLWDAGLRGLAGLFGPRHLLAKLGALAVAIVVVVAMTTTVEYRVHAPATLEPTRMRVVAAPQSGFIETADVRAGDTVAAGQVLATLEREELELERRQLESERERYKKEQRAALAEADRSESAIASARTAQADARLELIAERLARTRIVAPYDAVVVSGDLSQSLGAPVEDGQVLFQVAPREGYRVRLEVDERDIAELTPGQAGALALTGLPDSRVPLKVERILPVSTSGDGRNTFAVEASLTSELAVLRPGMSGVAKVEVGERKLWWVWTHTLVDWLRVQLWSWTG